MPPDDFTGRRGVRRTDNRVKLPWRGFARGFWCLRGCALPASLRPHPPDLGVEWAFPVDIARKHDEFLRKKQLFILYCVGIFILTNKLYEKQPGFCGFFAAMGLKNHDFSSKIVAEKIQRMHTDDH